MIQFLAFTVVICDQLSKAILSKILTPGESFSVIRGILHLTLVYNRGAAFGLFPQATLYLIVISVIIIISIIRYSSRIKKKRGCIPGKNIVAISWGLGLILGGATSNLIDRLRFGYVIDFLDFRIWPVFNIADSAITIGAAVLFFSFLKGSPEGTQLLK
jgi:signal peptidase II